MRVLRQRIRIGSCVAMLAIWAGILLSFGHVHVHTSLGHGAIALESGSDHADDEDDKQHTARCDVCALLSQFSATVLAGVLAFAVVRLAQAVERSRPAMRIPAAAVRIGFRSRAPPLS